MESILVLALIARLGHDDYKSRELAHKSLHDLLPVAAPYLYEAQSHQDEEIAARSQKLFQTWAWQTADTVRPTQWPYLPWIDSLPHTYPERTKVIEGYLSMADGDNAAPIWQKYRNATRLFVYRLLCQGQSVAQVQDVLDTMVPQEKGWIKKSQHAYKFPKEMLLACD